MEVFSCFFALRDELLHDGLLHDGLFDDGLFDDRLFDHGLFDDVLAASAREEPPPGAGKDTQVRQICYGVGLR